MFGYLSQSSNEGFIFHSLHFHTTLTTNASEELPKYLLFLYFVQKGFYNNFI
jgi:hypothetical protein